MKIIINFLILVLVSKALKIGRTNIKNCILSGKIYKGYKFNFG